MRLKNSLSLKIVLLILIVILPLITLLFFDNFYGMSILRKQVAQSNNNLLSVYMSQLDDKLEDITTYLELISNHDLDMINYATYPDGSLYKSEAAYRIIHRMTSQIEYSSDVELFFIYSDDELLFTTDNKYNLDKELLKNKIEGVIFVNETTGNNKWQLLEYEDNYKLIKIIKTKFGNYTGAWLGLESLLDPLSGLDLGNSGGIHIITENGFPLLSTFSTQDTLGIINHNDLDYDNESYRTVEDIKNEGKFMVVADTLENLPISFIAMLPEREVFKNLLVFRRMIFFIPVAGIIVLLLYLVLIRNVLFKPLNKLISAMKRIAQGDLSVRMVEDSSYEFNFLYSSFNDMIERVKLLKMDVYEEKILLQKAELKHLQSQIKPHFFLNSLNIVYNLAVLKDFESIKQMTLYLGSYLRFTLKNEDQMVSIKEEIAHVENYLEIQKLRFVDKFNYNINNISHDDIMIPPLTIQPFVENSIIHGYNKKVDRFLIDIFIKLDYKTLYMKISDNGKGFSKNDLIRLNKKDFSQKNGEHIGIWNVYRRLVLHYGTDISLSFSNNDSGGGIVEIKISNVIEEGEENV